MGKEAAGGAGLPCVLGGVGVGTLQVWLGRCERVADPGPGLGQIHHSLEAAAESRNAGQAGLRSSS